MVDRLDSIGARNSQTAGMTASAIFRRAFEHAIDVARLTTLRRVYASQRKTGFYVVEVAQRRLRERLPAHQYEQKRKRIPQQPRQKMHNSRATRAMQELHGALPCSTFQIASC